MEADALAHTAYNVSSGRPFTHRQLAAALEAALPGTEVELREGRSTDPGEASYLDVSRLRAETGFEADFDVATAVAHYVAWRTENPR